MLLLPWYLLTPIKIVSTDDYMPMTINTPEDYEKVLSVSWIIQEQSPEELTYVALFLCSRPCHLTLSQVSMRAALLADVSTVLHRH